MGRVADDDKEVVVLGWTVRNTNEKTNDGVDLETDE